MALLCFTGISLAFSSQTYLVLKSGAGGKAEFPVTSDVIAKLKETEFKVPLTDQDENIHTVRGPLLRDLLAAAGVSGKAVVATAADGYEVEIPMSDITNYDVIVAVAVDGKPITVDENGPSRILYPVLDNPKLKDDDKIAERMAFQLKQLTVK
jgi:hypothetical protein